MSHKGRDGDGGGDGEKEAVVRPFVEKLYSLVHYNMHPHVMSWNASGNAVVVKGADLEVEKVLRVFFKDIHFTSFVRQFNYYGFTKQKDSRVWRHPLFLAGRRDLLPLIKRKPSSIQYAAKKNKSACKKSPQPQQPQQPQAPQRPRRPVCNKLEDDDGCVALNDDDHGNVHNQPAAAVAVAATSDLTGDDLLVVERSEDVRALEDRIGAMVQEIEALKVDNLHLRSEVTFLRYQHQQHQQQLQAHAPQATQLFEFPSSYPPYPLFTLPQL